MNRSEHSSDLHIRLAKPEEAEDSASVLREAFDEFALAYTPAAFAATTPTAEQIRERWSEGPVWVVVWKGEIVGTVAAVSRDGATYLRSMAILPASRRQGIGRLLLEQVEQFARSRGDTRLFLSTTPFLIRAIRLYEKFGFQPSADGPRELFGTPLFTMTKLLPPEA